MAVSSIDFSIKSKRTPPSPISYFMEQAIENPSLINLAAGLVDTASLPVEEFHAAVDNLLKNPQQVRSALQYGTTQGLLPLREAIVRHLYQLDSPNGSPVMSSANDVFFNDWFPADALLAGRTAARSR